MMYAYTYVPLFVCVCNANHAISVYSIHHAKTFWREREREVQYRYHFQASECAPMETDRGLEMLLKPLACRKLCRYSILALSFARLGGYMAMIGICHGAIPILYGRINRFKFGGAAKLVAGSKWWDGHKNLASPRTSKV